MTFKLETTLNEKIPDEIIEAYNIKKLDDFRDDDYPCYEISLSTLDELINLSIDLGSQLIVVPKVIANKDFKETDNDGVIEVYNAYRE